MTGIEKVQAGLVMQVSHLLTDGGSSMEHYAIGEKESKVRFCVLVVPEELGEIIADFLTGLYGQPKTVDRKAESKA